MKKRYFIILVLLAAIISTSAQATLVKPLNLQNLVGIATYVVKATVTDKVIEEDVYESGAIVNYYTLEIKEWVKGTPPSGMEKEIIIKQLASGEFTQGSKTIRQNVGFPEYEIGKTYVFFLPKPHAVSGLLAPIGLMQGVFEVQTDKQGKETIPALTKRAKLLSKGLVVKKNQAFLSKQLNAAASGSDNTYSSFKSMINSVKGEAE
ncbi:MAG: hypothetical protein ABII18_00895 [bacterium]|nr:hypothetical protein [bacterium]MBU1917961.1 hypothetical protein [bacterium]